METLTNAAHKTPEWSNFPAVKANKSFAHQSVVYKDRLFTIGGQVHDVVYDSISSTFLTSPYFTAVKSKMLQGRSYFGAELIGDKIVILGGSASPFLSYAEYFRSVEVYDIHKNECKPLKPLPIAWSQMATVNRGDSVILIGGMTRIGHIGNTSNNVFMYHLTGESKWLPPMKYRRAGCSAVISGNGIVVMGGLGESFEFVNFVEYFSFDNWSWVELPAMIEARSFPTALSLKKLC